MTIRVALVGDQQLARAGFQYVLEAQPDLAVVGTAGDGRTALAMIEQTAPDVVLMDIRMPDMDGIKANPTDRRTRSRSQSARAHHVRR